MRKEFPTAAEWQDIYLASPFPSLLVLSEGPYGPETRSTDIDAFARGVTLSRLELELRNRVADVARCYVFMMFYFGQGIPDERWYISPGRKGQSIEYFPDFEDDHFAIKSWFDFYADTFYHRIFGAWDVVGHILNARFDLELKSTRVDFGRAVKRLGRNQQQLARALDGVRSADIFAAAHKLRNDSTHNEAPSSVGMAVVRSDAAEARVYSMGQKVYVTSAAIIENATAAVGLFRRTLEALKLGAT